MSSLSLPLQLRKFESGVLVLEDVSGGGNESVLASIASRIDAPGTYLTAIELASDMGMSLILAKEYLGMAENKGIAARDESYEGIRFYSNIWAA